MSGFHTSAVDAAVVCLRVMRRFLQDEETTLAQLNYLIENIHDPLAQACLPPSQRPIVPAPSASNPHSNSRPGSVARQHCVNACARPLGQSNEGDSKPNAQTQPPQPAVIAPQGGATVPRAASPAASKHLPSPAARKTGGKSLGPPVPLTFSQYWDLFANLPTLYAVQLSLVQHLEGIVQRLLCMVDELQPPCETADSGAPPPQEDSSTLHSRHPSNTASPDAHPASGAAHGSMSSRKHVSALRFPVSGSVPGTRGVCGEIGVMVNDFFGSESMQRYMAEHMMYTIKYTQRAAPQLLRLSRVWRWTGGAEAAAAAGTAGVPSAALANLGDADRTMLLQYTLFLDFLWRSLGPHGVPADSRVAMSPSIESHIAITQACTPTETASGSSAADASAGASAGINNGQRRARTPGTAAGTGAATTAMATSTGGNPSALPPIPAMWEGFRTILQLLGTPLGGLRRYSHVARCLVESNALQAKDRKRLQTSFIDVVAIRMSEETNLVMEELWTHDAAGIMALMDMPGTRPTGDKAGIQASPRRARTGGVGVAGVVGSGLHNGHMITQSSSAGGAAAGAAPVSGTPPPAPPALGANNSNGSSSNNSMPSVDCSNRALIHYGRLSKRFGRGRHERLAFLFSDWMCYVEECSNGRFRVRGTIPLPDLRVVEARDEETSDAMHGFELLSPSLPKRLIFFTSSPEQRGQWVEAIRYTVRRFCDQDRTRHEGASGATSTHAIPNSSVVAPAVTIGETGLPSVMRSTAPMLSSHSRLRRQRRYDKVWQDYVDVQRRMTEALAQTSPTQPGLSSTSLGGIAGGGGSVFGSLASIGQSPPLQANLSGDASRNSSFGGQRSNSTHRQLEYDVTPWTQHVSTHRRIRSQDLFAALQQQQQQQQQLQASAPSSQTASSTHSAGTCLTASPHGGPEEAENTTMMLPTGGKNSTNDTEVTASMVGEGDKGHKPSPPRLSVSGVEGSSAGHLDRRGSSSLRPSFLEAVGSASTRIGNNYSFSTPLRRPVSERFEAVKSMGSSTPVNSPAQQQELLRRCSTSSFNVSSSTPTPSASVLPSDAGVTQASTALPLTSGATCIRSREEQSAAAVAGGGNSAVEKQDTATASPLPQDSVDAEQIVLEDSTTELSAPVEGGEDAVVEEAEESESASENPVVIGDDDTETKQTQHRSHRTSIPHPLYSDMLDDLTNRKGAAAEGEEEDASNHPGVCSDYSGRCPSTDKLDRLFADSSDGRGDDAADDGDTEAGAEPMEPFDEDLHDESVPSQTLYREEVTGAAASGPRRDTGTAGPALLSSLLEGHEEHHASAGSRHALHEEASLSGSEADRLKTAVQLDKLMDDDDTSTAVVTAFRRTNSPARSAMSPISPVASEIPQQQQPQPTGKRGETACNSVGERGGDTNIASPMAMSTEPESESHNATALKQKPLSTLKDGVATPQRNQHADPTAK
jgi:hypothetical protein